MATKHDKILKFIESTPIGNKLSVRSIAKELNVSEGTAYRAIKDAEEQNLVTTIQRVGTIRIENHESEYIGKLTFSDILKIIDGEILGGHSGLDKTLNRFYIGAMTEEAMLRYVSEESLMIIGNRERAQKLSLEYGAAVLITGGFNTSQEIVNLSNELELPILSTSYDTFTVASIINRAITDQLIVKEIMVIGNIYTRLQDTDYLTTTSTIYDYKLLNKKSNHSRFPIITENNRLIGVITARDVIGKKDDTLLERVMTRDPKTAKPHMSVASVAHSMIWDGFEVMPVVADDFSLMGIISRQDIMKAMQSQPNEETFKDTIAEQIDQMIEEGEEDSFHFTVTPRMTNNLGNISFGVLSEVIAESVLRLLEKESPGNVLLEQVQLHYFKVIQLGNKVTIKPKIFDESRRSVRLDVDVFTENGQVAKELMTCQYIEKR